MKMMATDLFTKYRKSINPPYSREDFISILGTILLLISIPIIALSVEKLRDMNSKAVTLYGVEIGVDAYTEHINSEPSGLTYVYKYVTGQSWQSYISNYMNAAYAKGLKPVFVYYTSYDNPYSIDFVGWDQLMTTIRSDGREAWVVIEPDLVGYLRNNGECSTTLKNDMDRFLLTKVSNAHLGYMMSPWLVPYDGAQSDAAGQKSCWLAAGGDRLEDIYVDVSDRDQETKGTYPWTSAQITTYEQWFQALHSETGRKIGVWQIPMGNSNCNNGKRSNLVETWLTSGKLTTLSPYVNKMLFGPGDEGNAGDPQSWNIPPPYSKYDCGFFNQKVTELTSGQSDTQVPTVSITSPTASSTVSGSVNISANASDNVGVTKVEFFVDGSSVATDTISPYSISWDSRAAVDGTHTIVAKAYDASGNVGTSSSIPVSVNNTTGKIGDLNSDNKVDIFDLSILLTKWGTSDATADLNKNGTVDIFDLSILLSKWGS